MKKPPKPNPNRDVNGNLTCAFGEPWLGPHPLCREAVAYACKVPIAEVALVDLTRFRLDDAPTAEERR
jgi:hypothetical protein